MVEERRRYDYRVVYYKCIGNNEQGLGSVTIRATIPQITEGLMFAMQEHIKNEVLKDGNSTVIILNIIPLASEIEDETDEH